MEVKGIFVTKISKAEAYKCFDDITKKYGNRATMISGNNKQQAATMKQWCHDLNEVIDNIFFSEMYGASRCKKRIDKLAFKLVDGIQLQTTVSEILGIIIDLRVIIDRCVPISELPSCKSLTEIGIEDAISASKDLINSNVVKIAIGALMTLVDAGKIIGIVDIRSYYKELIDELKFELSEEQREPSEIEQFLMDKYESEVAYCNLAGLKVGLSGFKEIADLKNNAQKAINKFENQINHEPLAINSKTSL